MRRMLLGAALLAFACDDDSSASPCTGPGCDPDATEAGPMAGDATSDGASGSLDALDEDGPRPTDGALLDGPLPDGPLPDGPLADGPEPDGPEPDGPTPDGPRPDGAPPDGALADGAPGDGPPFDGPGPDARADVGADARVVECPGGDEPEAEVCDGEDNDCDERTDEDFDLAEACDGEGRCGFGFVECDDEGGVRCSTEPGGTTAQDRDERCNGEDDDCDGVSDEHPELLATVCYTGPPDTEGVGECSAGMRLCVDGRRQACAGDTTPRPERCDGRDNDCDEVVDEGYEPVLTCGEGVCVAGSVPSACVGGAERPCAPGPPAGDDLDCNGRDDDCDGETDEGYVVDDACGQGRCGAAATPSRCVNGVELPCEPGLPAQRDPTCDGIDDDCDDRIDEDYAVVARCGQGICLAAATPSACDDGVETPCRPGDPEPDDSLCDGIDSDCDGFDDEHYVGDDSCGLGVCARAPLPSRCQAGVEFECVPSLPTGDDDDCNGTDEDCDGASDEHYAAVQACGEGACRARSTPATCLAGVETACEPGRPLGEADANCDLVDDDCDGVADEDVVILLGGERRLTNDAAGSVRPRLVASGGGYMVAWVDNRLEDAHIFLRRLDAQGAPAADLQRISVRRGSHFQPSVVPAGEGYGVAWHGTGEGVGVVYFARVDANGVVVGGDVDLSGGGANAAHAEVVWNGQEYAVAWTDSRHGDSEVYFRRVSAAGEAVGGAVRVTNVAGEASVPSLVHLGAGRGYAVAYNEHADGVFNVWLQRMDAAGAPVGAPQRVSTGPDNANAPRLLHIGGGYAVTWYDTRDDNTEIYVARLDANGARIGDNIRVTNGAHPSVLPSIVRTVTGYGVAWQDRRAGNHEIWFRHLDDLGVPVAQPVRISNDPDNSFGPSLAWTGDTFGVAWYDTRHGEGEIYFARGPFGCPPE